MSQKQLLVLIIEDDSLNRKLFRDILKIDNIKSLEAEDAEQGLILARQQQPDLILMDIQLPGMDGLEATRLIKQDQNLKDIPVVALSAHAMENDINNAFKAGCDGYITKPVEVASFNQKVLSFLQSPS